MSWETKKKKLEDKYAELKHSLEEIEKAAAEFIRELDDMLDEIQEHIDIRVAQEIVVNADNMLSNISVARYNKAIQEELRNRLTDLKSDFAIYDKVKDMKVTLSDTGIVAIKRYHLRFSDYNIGLKDTR